MGNFQMIERREAFLKPRKDQGPATCLNRSELNTVRSLCCSAVFRPRSLKKDFRVLSGMLVQTIVAGNGPIWPRSHHHLDHILVAVLCGGLALEAM